ncbi:MAG: LacI family transcriptional regulator [Chloroflexi bacterium]|nr:LacI family transcriptional regulator [Chloroflexota bacterium]
MSDLLAPPFPFVRVTRNDVARRAGVSTAVVSYVVNDGPRPVSAEKRARVLKAIADLGYRRDNVAAALSSRRSGIIGLLVPDATNPFFADLARQIEDHVFARGMTVLIGNSEEERAREARHIEAFLSHRVDGVIAALADVDAPLPEALNAHRDRVVLVDRVPATWTGRSIAIDNGHGGWLAGRHLDLCGRARVAILAGPRGFRHVEDRVAGCRSGLGAGAAVSVIAADGFTFRDGVEAMRRAAAGAPDAIFCLTDALAMGALAAIEERGWRVPRDIAVVGYDDVTLAEIARPRLTTVRQPIAEIARQALALLREPSAARTVVLRPDLVVRESTDRTVGLSP